MKYWHLLILAAWVISISEKTYKIKTGFKYPMGIKMDSLNGRVKMITDYEYKIDSNGVYYVNSKYIAMFDKNGRMDWFSDSSSSGIKKYVYSYNGNGRIELSWDSSSSGIIKSVYAYNVIGNVTIKRDSSYHTLTSQTIYKYNKLGLIKKEKEFTSDGRVITSLKYKYNKQHNISNEFCKKTNPRGVIYKKYFTKTHYKYDTHNNLIEENTNGRTRCPSFFGKTKYVFDSNNKEIKRLVYLKDGSLFRRDEKEYDANGNITLNKIFFMPSFSLGCTEKYVNTDSTREVYFTDFRSVDTTETYRTIKDSIDNMQNFLKTRFFAEGRIYSVTISEIQYYND